MKDFMKNAISISKTTVTAFLTGLIAGAVIAYSVSRQEKPADRQELTDLKAKLGAVGRVVCAVKDVPEGEEFTRDALTVREILETKIPVDAIKSTELQFVLGRPAKYGVSSGTIVSQHDIASFGSYYYCRLPEGMRAVSFQIDEPPRGGLIEPDSLIDIYTIKGSGAREKMVPILSRTKVLAVGSVYDRHEYEASRRPPLGPITIGVTPKQANDFLHSLATSTVYVRPVLVVKGKPIVTN